MKKRLFIVSNYLTLLNSIYVIESSSEKAVNHLMLVANYCKQSFYDDMKLYANNYKLFDKCFLCREYLLGDKFDFARFRNEISSEYDEIYSTCFYYQSAIVIDKFENSDLYLLANGLASYMPQAISPSFISRIKGFYFWNYFGKMEPYLCSELGIPAFEIPKDYYKAKFSKVSEQLPEIVSAGKIVIFCAHNLFLCEKSISINEEFLEYKKVVEYYVKQGYTVYFKDHPKTPDLFADKFAAEFPDKVVSLSKVGTYPVESIIVKILPDALVSLFSSSIFAALDLYDIKSYTFEFSHNLNSFFLLGYVLSKSYFKTIGENFEYPQGCNDLCDLPIYQVLLSAVFLVKFSKSKFDDLCNMLSAQDFKELNKYRVQEHFLKPFELKDYEMYSSLFSFKS